MSTSMLFCKWSLPETSKLHFVPFSVNCYALHIRSFAYRHNTKLLQNSFQWIGSVVSTFYDTRENYSSWRGVISYSYVNVRLFDVFDYFLRLNSTERFCSATPLNLILTLTVPHPNPSFFHVGSGHGGAYAFIATLLFDPSMSALPIIGKQNFPDSFFHHPS